MQSEVSIRPLAHEAAKRVPSRADRRLLPMFALLAVLGGCASPAPTPPSVAARPPADDGVATGRYVGGPVMLECVPFARALSGVDLHGPAADWWQRADGRYARTARPAVGAVLVFRRTDRLRHGHAAVVSRLVSNRTILVTQANWVPHRITEDLPVLDVSPANDWSAVRVWWPPSGQMGVHRYPTWGFILPDRPLSRDGLEASLRETLRVTSSD